MLSFPSTVMNKQGSFIRLPLPVLLTTPEDLQVKRPTELYQLQNREWQLV